MFLEQRWHVWAVFKGILGHFLCTSLPKGIYTGMFSAKFWDKNPILGRCGARVQVKIFFSKENPIFSPNLIYGHHTMCTLAKNSKKDILTTFLCDFPLEWLQGLLHRDFRAKFWDKNPFLGRCGGGVQVKIFFGRGNGIFYQLLKYYEIWRHFCVTDCVTDWLTAWLTDQTIGCL